ncbi:MAG: hypothetical protein QXS50_01470 [Candidatus Caldarchaeum sp.]
MPALKTLGGLGYIFSIIPGLNLVAPFLIGIAWFQMGGRTRQTLFRATGVFIIITYVAALGFLAVFAATFLPLIFSVASLGEAAPISDVLSMLSTVAVFGLVGFLVAVFGFVSFILELVSHFRASGVFLSKWFRRAAWMRILSIIIAVVLVVAVGVFSVLAPAGMIGLNGDFAVFGSAFLLIFIPVIVIGLLAPIFSAVAFFTIPEAPPPPPDVY